ncbi:MAG: manganese efflux pump, partial [Myxococcales bacterium]
EHPEAQAERQGRAGPALSLGLCFGVFQGMMPLLGWRLGAWLGPVIEAFDHWIAFVLLGGIGLKMIHESRQPADEDDGAPAPPTVGVRELLVLGLATSIDALAVGVTLPLLPAPPPVSALVIGVVTAALSVAGYVVGRRFGAMFGRRLDAFGGVVLIGMGVKILVEHLRAEHAAAAAVGAAGELLRALSCA